MTNNNNKQQKFSKKKPSKQLTEPRVAGTEASEPEVFSYDNFEIKVIDDLIKTEHIREIELPKFSFNGSVKNLSVEEKTPLQVTLYDTENSCQRLLVLAKKGIFDIKLLLKNNNNKIRSTLTFNGASVKVIDFGSLINGPREGHRLILCELHYKEIEIDGVKI